MDIFVLSCIQGWLYFPMTLLVSIEHASDHLPINTTSRHSIYMSASPPRASHALELAHEGPHAGLAQQDFIPVGHPLCPGPPDLGGCPLQHPPQPPRPRELPGSPRGCLLHVRRRNLKLVYTHASIHTNIFTHMHTYIYVCICIHTSIKHMEVKRNGGS